MSLSPAYAPVNESAADLWAEKSNFIGLTCLGSAVNGVAFVVFLLALSALLPQLHTSSADTKKWTYINIAFVTIVFALGTIGNAGSARTAQLTWIDNRNYPGGPNAFTVDQYNIPSNIMGDAGFVLASWCQDAYLLYRFLMFYNMNYWLAIFPGIIFLGQVASSIVFLVEVSLPGGTLWSPLGIDFTTSWFMLSIFLNVILTILIVGRLLFKRRAISKVLGAQHSTHYTSIAALLVESAALYSVTGIIFVGTFLTANPVQNLILPILGMCTVISPTLIIYRVAIGRAWTHSTVNQLSGKNSSIQFSPPRYYSNKSSNGASGYTASNPTVVQSFDSYELRDKDGKKGTVSKTVTVSSDYV